MTIPELKYFMLITVQSGNGIVLDSKWTSTSGVATVDSTVCALLTKYTSGGGVVRVIGKPARYTKTGELPGTVLLVLGPGEEFLLLGPLSVRYIRHRSAQ